MSLDEPDTLKPLFSPSSAPYPRSLNWHTTHCGLTETADIRVKNEYIAFTMAVERSNCIFLRLQSLTCSI